MLTRWLSVVVLASIAGLGARCTAAPKTHSAPVPRSATTERPNILLISVDTLRADHLSGQGYAHLTSPYLDELAAQGVRFSRAYSTSSWTVPSLVSLLTSSYPSRHGMGESARRGKASWSVIPKALPTIAELLKAQGYRTYGLTANFGLPAERGFGRGFDQYLCVGAVDRKEVRPALDPWLMELDSGSGPWFLWLHLFDPHAPYTPRQTWMPQFWHDGRQEFAFLDVLPADKIARLAPRLRPEAMAYMRALYDSEIRDADDYVREVVQRFPPGHEPLVVFTADHGEEFLDHGGMLHGRTLHEETIHIPLIVRFPDRRFAGTVVDEPVSLVDVAPTILDGAGLPVPEGLAGARLFGAQGFDPPPHRLIVAELERGSVIRARIDVRYKLIHDEAHPERSTLYDLSADPSEQRDLASAQPAEFQRLEQELDAFVKANPSATAGEAPTPITAEQLEALRNLGYVD